MFRNKTDEEALRKLHSQLQTKKETLAQAQQNLQQQDEKHLKNEHLNLENISTTEDHTLLGQQIAPKITSINEEIQELKAKIQAHKNERDADGPYVDTTIKVFA